MTIRRINKPWRWWLAAALAFSLIAGACGGTGDDGESQPSQAVETTETAAPSESADSGAADDDRPVEADGAGDGAGEAAAAPADAEPEEQEPLVAPVDTTTTTTAPPPAEDGEEAVVEAPAEPEPQFGGTLRVAVEAEGDSLNPAAGNFAVSAYVMTYPVFDPVAYWDTQGRWIPYLAESFTPINGGESWQMKLREGVRFHDGSTLDADDVIATYEAQLLDPVVSLAVRPFFPETGGVVRIDDLTVQYNPLKPMAYFPQFVTSQLGMIAPSEWLARAREDATLNQFPVGTGPFMIESRVQDEKTVLVRNPDYWAADITDIYLDRIEVEPTTDTVIAAERLAAGEIDLMVTSNSDAILTLRDYGDAGVRTIENVRSSEDFAMMNIQQPPFNDIRARQALTFATNRDAYVALIRQGTAPAADSMFHPDLVWHNPDVKQETDMPEKAGPLVAAYCADNPGDYEWPVFSGERRAHCTDGRINVELQYSGPSVAQTRIADLLIDGWEDYFNVTQQELLQDDHIVETALGFFNVVTWRQFGAVDPDNDVLWIQCDSIDIISLNWPRDCDPERDALLYEQRRIDDLDRRVEIWHQISEDLRDSYTYIFFNHANWTIGARDNVHNVCGQTSPDGVELFCNNQGRVQLHQIWLS
jgi:ABC-type transport system substrate-binding protein